MSELVNIISGKVVSRKAPAAVLGNHESDRCTGRTTGQALRLIGTAMGQPGKHIGIIDHHDASQGAVMTQGRVATESLVHRMRELIKAAKLRGFTIAVNVGKHYISYQPLVPVEKVVKEWINGQREE